MPSFSAVDTELKLKRQTQLGVQFGKFPLKRPVVRSPPQVHQVQMLSLKLDSVQMCNKFAHDWSFFNALTGI